AAALAHGVDFFWRHAWKIVLLFLVIAVVAFQYSTHRFVIDTVTAKLFPSDSRPHGGTFFQRDGLLFLPTADVKHLTDQLIAAQPLLGPLAADPSLRGLMDVFARFLEGVQHGEAKLVDFERPMGAIGDMIADVLAGKLHPLAWRTLFTGSQPTLRELRRFILVKPTLDY